MLFLSLVLSAFYLHSYPSLVSVPSILTDDCICRVGRVYRAGRFPVATWRHPNSKALLLRGAGVHSRTALTKLNRGPIQGQGAMVGGVVTASAQASSSHSDGSSHSVEHEKFLSAIVSATPLSSLMRHGSAWRLADSSLSLNSLAHTASTSLPNTQHMMQTSSMSVSVSPPPPLNGNMTANNMSRSAIGVSGEAGSGGGQLLYSPPPVSLSSSHAGDVNSSVASSFNTTTNMSHHHSSLYNSSYGSPYPHTTAFSSAYLHHQKSGSSARDYPTLTPEVARRNNPLAKAINTLR